MNPLNTILIFVSAFLAVFGEAVLPGFRNLLGAQVDLLPAIMVYAALSANITVVALLAIFGGLWFNSFSASPLGITILPLFAVGFAIFSQRDLILRQAGFAQMILGAAASAVVPALTLLLLLSAGKEPLLGWGSLWQWLVMTAGGASATPFIFALFNWCNHALGYQLRTESSFRPDREIRRDKKSK
jgi:cell shape-determining protein MreD